MMTLIAQVAEASIPELQTTGGIVASVIVITQILKHVLKRVSVLRHIPTWVYAVAVSIAVTMIAVLVLKTIHGDLMTITWEVIKAAAMASGFYSWYSRINDSPDKRGTESAANGVG